MTNTGSPTPVYRRLTGLKRGFSLRRLREGSGQMSQLAVAGDHLLAVSSSGYSESYRRFYFRDIQAFLVLHTDRRTYWAVTLVAVMVVVATLVNLGNAGWTATAIAAGLFVPLLVWNHLRGPGAHVVIFSAVQQEPLYALTRLPKARRVIAELKPLIEAAQADLGPAPAAASVSAVAAVPTAAGAADAGAPAVPASGDARLAPPPVPVAPSAVPPPLPPPIPPKP